MFQTARKKEKRPRKKPFFKLSYPDSNQDKQNQNLLCYHYTIRQCPFYRSSFGIRMQR